MYRDFYLFIMFICKLRTFLSQILELGENGNSNAENCLLLSEFSIFVFTLYFLLKLSLLRY